MGAFKQKQNERKLVRTIEKKLKGIRYPLKIPKGVRKSKRDNVIVFFSRQSDELTKNTLIEFESRLVERFCVSFNWP